MFYKGLRGVVYIPTRPCFSKQAYKEASFPGIKTPLAGTDFSCQFFPRLLEIRTSRLIPMFRLLCLQRVQFLRSLPTGSGE